MSHKELPTFITKVVATHQLTPRMRRITVGGGDLVDFAPVGPDQFLYMLLPPPGHTELTIDASFTWAAYREMPDDLKPVGAYYTVRNYRPEVAEIDLDVVLHDEGDATTWARRAQPGDPLALWGPRLAYEPPDDIEWQLLAADETGLPAIAAILESLDEGARARVFIEVADTDEEQPLPTKGDVEVTWLHRNGVPAGESDLLGDAVTAWPVPSGEGYVWGAGESRMMTAIRRHARTTCDIPRSHVALLAYWRHPTLGNDDAN